MILRCNYCAWKIIVVYLVISCPLGMWLVCILAELACARQRVNISLLVCACTCICPCMQVNKRLSLVRYRWKGGKQLILNASPFLNLKLEVNEGKKKRNPKGKLASNYTHFIFYTFCFYFMAAQLWIFKLSLYQMGTGRLRIVWFLLR